MTIVWIFLILCAACAVAPIIIAICVGGDTVKKEFRNLIEELKKKP